MSLTYASRIHHSESLLTSAFVRARIVDANVIAAVLFLALVNIVTFEIIDLVPLKAFLARAHHDIVHRSADLLAAAVVILARIGWSTRSIPRLVIRWAFTAEGSHGINALVITSAVIARAFIDIGASFFIQRQLVARRTGAEIAADGIGAIM